MHNFLAMVKLTLLLVPHLHYHCHAGLALNPALQSAGLSLNPALYHTAFIAVLQAMNSSQEWAPAVQQDHPSPLVA